MCMLIFELKYVHKHGGIGNMDSQALGSYMTMTWTLTTHFIFWIINKDYIVSKPFIGKLHYIKW